MYFTNTGRLKTDLAPLIRHSLSLTIHDTPLLFHLRDAQLRHATKKRFTPVFSVSGVNVFNKAKTSKTKRNYLIRNYFMGNNPVYSG